MVDSDLRDDRAPRQIAADDRSSQERAATVRSHRLAVSAVALLAIVVAVAVLVATASGFGVSPDGVAYLSLADELRSNGSPYAVLAPSPTHYAPLWAMIVGVVSWLTSIDDLLLIGRVLNTIVAASIPFLVYLAVRRAVAAPAWWAVLAAAAASLTFGLFRLSVRALTEPLFVALLIVTLLLIEAGRRRRSRPLLLAAAAVAAAATLTRFAGVAVLVPLAIAALTLAPTWRRRLVDVVTVAAITVAPTALWSLAAPSTTASTHLGSGDRASIDDGVQSIVEAGYALVDPPTDGYPDPIYFVLGFLVLAAPFAAAVAVARRESSDGIRASLARLDSLGLAPWLLFLVAYSVLIGVQRWWIAREVIDRYWVPFVVVAVIVVARVVAELGLLLRRRSRRIAIAAAGGIALVNFVLILAFVATRSSDGIELNEVRYQDAELFDTVADADVEVVLTDSTRLIELHVVALGGNDVEVRSIGCSATGGSRVVELAERATAPTAVVLAGPCDREETVDALLALPSSLTVTDEAGVGTLVLIDPT